MIIQELYNTHVARLKTVPDAKGIPLLGNTLSVLKDPLNYLVELKENYGDLVKVRLGTKTFYVIQNPEACRHILQENARNYYKPGAAKMMKRFLGEGLATTNGKQWLQHRRMIQPAFHRNKIAGLTKTISEETDLLIDKWKQMPGRNLVDINQAFLKLTLGNITKTMFGTDLNHKADDIATVINNLLASASKSVTSLVKFPLYIPTPANRKFIRANRSFEKIIYSIIEQRRVNPNEEEADLLDLLLNTCGDETGAGMNAKQLRDEITTIFMAGHETTAQTLSWVFYQLSLNPGIYKKIKEEALFLDESPAILEAIQKMECTKRMIEETMRMYPPVWVMARKSIEPDQVNGYYLPAGATVLINVYGMNHCEDYWKDAPGFHPERFTPAEKENRHPFLFIPFGAGQRVCIGNQFAMMVMQVVVSKLVREFEYELPPGSRVKPEANVTLRAKGGISLFVKKN